MFFGSVCPSFFSLVRVLLHSHAPLVYELKMELSLLFIHQGQKTVDGAGGGHSKSIRGKSGGGAPVAARDKQKSVGGRRNGRDPITNVGCTETQTPAALGAEVRLWLTDTGCCLGSLPDKGSLSGVASRQGLLVWGAYIASGGCAACKFPLYRSIRPAGCATLSP